MTAPGRNDDRARRRRGVPMPLTVPLVVAITVAVLGAVGAPGAGAQQDEGPGGAPGPDTTVPTTTVPTTTVPTTTAPPPTAPPASSPPPPVPSSGAATPGVPGPVPRSDADRDADRGARPGWVDGSGPWSWAERIAAPARDDVESAVALLGAVDAELAAGALEAAALRDELAAAQGEAGSAEAAGDELDAAAAALESIRKRRAVAGYVHADALGAARLSGLLDERGRVVASMEAVDAADADAAREARAGAGAARERVGAARTRAEGVRVRQGELERRLSGLRDGRAAVVAKISGSYDTASPVPTGPSEIARRAAAADAARLAWMGARLVGGAEAAAARGALDAALSSLATSITAEPERGVRLAVELGALEPERLGVVLFALAQVGKPYVWAASGPASYDCSGLVLRAWAGAGVKLVHFSGTQARSGPPATPATIRGGDVLGYGPSSSLHITMYVGAGMVVEAKGRAYGVVVAPARWDAEALTHIGGLEPAGAAPPPLPGPAVP